MRVRHRLCSQLTSKTQEQAIMKQTAGSESCRSFLRKDCLRHGRNLVWFHVGGDMAREDKNIAQEDAD